MIMDESRERAEQIAVALEGHRFRGHAERDYQRGVEQVLQARGIDYLREYRLTAADRIDFLAGSVGIEVKMKAQRSLVLRQLSRYAQAEAVSSLLLVCAIAPPVGQMPEEVGGVPLVVLTLRGSFL